MIPEIKFINRTKRDVAPLEDALRGYARDIGGTSHQISDLGIAFEIRPNTPPFGNFRVGVHPTRFFDSSGIQLPFAEITIDPRRVAEREIEEVVRSVLQGGSLKRVDFLEADCTADKSVAWHANSAYWHTINKWTDFGSQLPTGESDSVNRDFWSDKTKQIIIPRLKLIDSKHELPDQVRMLELGASGGEATAVMVEALESAAMNDPVLDEILRKSVVYLADYSASSLAAARERFLNSRVEVKVLNGDITYPKEAFPELADKPLAFVHAGNLLDNLGTRQIAMRKGQLFEEKVALFLDNKALQEIALRSGKSVQQLKQEFQTIITPELIDEINCDEASIETWQAIWQEAARFRQDFHKVSDPESYQIVPGAAGLKLTEVSHLVSEGSSVFLSDHAAITFSNVLELTHPYGAVQIVDLFKGNGPTKLAGSLYNPVNEGILSLIAHKRGFGTSIEPFRYNENSHSHIFTAAK